MTPQDYARVIELCEQHGEHELAERVRGASLSIERGTPAQGELPLDVPMPGGRCTRAGEVGFERFWEVWPTRVGKAKAAESWSKVSGGDRLKALEVLPMWVEHWRGQYDSGEWSSPWKFVPYPATWLNQQRWEDELPEDARVSKLSPLEQWERDNGMYGRDWD